MRTRFPALASMAAVLVLSCREPAAGAPATFSETFTTSIPIPDNDPTGISDTENLTLSGATSISSLEVTLQIEGDFMGAFNGDYYGYLQHADTGFAVLLNRVGVTRDNPYGYADNGMNVTFSDSAPNGDIHLYPTVVDPGGGALTGLWQPDGRDVDPGTVTDLSPRTAMLSAFNGMDPNGDWTLFVADMSPLGTGTLRGWGLSVTTGGPYIKTDTTVATAPDVNPSQYGQSVTFTATVTNLAGVTPTGEVVFRELTTELGRGTLSGSGGSATASSVTSVLVAGTHTITAEYGGDSSLNGNTNSMVVTVTPAVLTVTPGNETRLYGAANPILAASLNGFVNNENGSVVSGSPALSTVADITSPVGTYDIIANQGSLSAANYSFSFVHGALTVGAASLTITANSMTKTYGQSLTFAGTEFTPTGLVNGDRVTRVTLTSPGAAATATVAGSPYAITPGAAVGTGLGNYIISYQPGALTVLPAATPPVLAPLANQTVYADSLLSFRASATEIDQPPRTLTFSLGKGAPAGASIGRGTGPSPVSGLFTWTPTAAQAPSTNVITVIVTDNGVPPLSASNSFTVVVHPAPTPPVLAPLANQTVYAGSLLSFRASATETDQPPRSLTFSLGEGAPAGASIGRGTGPSPVSGLFTWIPTAAQAPSTNLITVIVTDNGVPPLSASTSFTVVVHPAPTPPVLAPLANQTVYAGSLLSFRASATETDQPPRTLTFSLGKGAPAGASIGRGTGPSPVSGLFIWTPTAAQAPSTNLITVIVTDNGVPPLSASNSFTVVVYSSNTPPVLLNPALAQSQFTVAVLTEVGRTYVLEATDTLDQNTWRAFPAIPGDGTLKTLTDSGATGPHRYYRVRIE